MATFLSLAALSNPNRDTKGSLSSSPVTMEKISGASEPKRSKRGDNSWKSALSKSIPNLGPAPWIDKSLIAPSSSKSQSGKCEDFL